MVRRPSTGVDPREWLREQFAELQRRVESEDADLAELVADVVGESSTSREHGRRARLRGGGHRVRIRITGGEGRELPPEADELTDADREALASRSDRVLEWLAEDPEHRALFAVDQVRALSLACPDLDQGTLDRFGQVNRRRQRGLAPAGFELDSIEVEVARGTDRGKGGHGGNAADAETGADRGEETDRNGVKR